jgi:hypothetical protein
MAEPTSTPWLAPPVKSPKLSDVVLKVGPVTLSHADFVGQTAEAVLTHPSGKQIQGRGSA